MTPRQHAAAAIFLIFGAACGLIGGAIALRAAAPVQKFAAPKAPGHQRCVDQYGRPHFDDRGAYLGCVLAPPPRPVHEQLRGSFVE